MGEQSDSTSDFIKLLTAHQAPLRAFVLSLIPGSDEVDDVIQDTNIVLWEKRHSFEMGSNFQAWMFTIARNMVKVHLRSTKRSQSPRFTDEIIDAVAETWYQRQDVASDRKQRALGYCMEQLNEKERALIEARYSDAESLKDQAQSFGHSLASMRVMLFRIREKLRECVEKRIILMERGYV